VTTHIRTKGFNPDRRFRFGHSARSASSRTNGSSATLCGAPTSDSDCGRDEAATLLDWEAKGCADLVAEQLASLCPSCRRLA
jgi:hypothetical protein